MSCPPDYERLDEKLCIYKDQNTQGTCPRPTQTVALSPEIRSALHRILESQRYGLGSGLSGGCFDCGCPGCVGHLHCSSCGNKQRK